MGPSDPEHHRLHGAFGTDRFGVLAEAFARGFGTPQFIICQTILVVAWIAVNAAAVALRWDPYPFILLNLAFSTQAAYAAPLILLAQTRQADRDHADAMERERRRAETEQRHDEAMQRQTELIEQVETLTRQLGAHMRGGDQPPR